MIKSLGAAASYVFCSWYDGRKDGRDKFVCNDASKRLPT